MSQIIDRITKLLALGERAGTEAEATAAMQKVHELLAKHHLSLDDVKSGPVAEEDYVRDEAEAAPRQPWQNWVWNAIAELYFCQHYTRKYDGTRSHLLIGKPSNIAVVKFVAAYVCRTGEAVARQPGKDQAYRNSFKKGFAARIIQRAKEEVRRAKSEGLTDSATGTALVVAPLYDQAKRDIERFMLEQAMKPKMKTSRTSVNDPDGFLAGKAAAGRGVAQGKRRRPQARRADREVRMSQPEFMNVIKVCDGGAVWWHVTRGDMAGEFETVADCIPDEATARLIAAGLKLLEAARRGTGACEVLAAECRDMGDVASANIWQRKADLCRDAVAAATSTEAA